MATKPAVKTAVKPTVKPKDEPEVAKAKVAVKTRVKTPDPEPEVEVEVEVEVEAEADEVVDAEAEVEEEGIEGTDDTEEEAEGDENEPAPHDILIDWIRATDPKFASQKSTETDGAYMARILGAVGKEPEEGEPDTFSELPEAIQDWCEEFGNILNDNTKTAADLKPLPGFVSNFGTATKGKGRVKIENTEGEPKQKKARVAPPKRESQNTIHIRRVVYANPDMTLEQVVAKLAEQGFDIKKSTVSTCRSGCMMSVGVIKALNANATKPLAWLTAGRAAKAA